MSPCLRLYPLYPQFSEYTRRVSAEVGAEDPEAEFVFAEDEDSFREVEDYRRQTGTGFRQSELWGTPGTSAGYKGDYQDKYPYPYQRSEDKHPTNSDQYPYQKLEDTYHTSVSSEQFPYQKLNIEDKYPHKKDKYPESMDKYPYQKVNMVDKYPYQKLDMDDKYPYPYQRPVFSEWDVAPASAPSPASRLTTAVLPTSRPRPSSYVGVDEATRILSEPHVTTKLASDLASRPRGVRRVEDSYRGRGSKRVEVEDNYREQVGSYGGRKTRRIEDTYSQKDSYRGQDNMYRGRRKENYKDQEDRYRGQEDSHVDASYSPGPVVSRHGDGIEAAVLAGAGHYRAEQYDLPSRLAFQIHGQQGPLSYRFGHDTGVG